MSRNIVVITPVKHIRGVSETLERIGNVIYHEDPVLNDIERDLGEAWAIYTNPNKSKVYIGRELFDMAPNLKVVCTASTGRNHIDLVEAANRSIQVISLTEEREIINRISSTAELAFALTLSHLRRVTESHQGALEGQWDYTRYIGRQMNQLTVGVLGYGRLGGLFSGYAAAMGAQVIVSDPYKNVVNGDMQKVSLSELAARSDILSLHVHVTDETTGIISAEVLSEMKEDVLIVNTSRGEIINETDMVAFLRAHPRARVATDVLSDEIRNREASPLLNFARESKQVLITQHIGGMTREAQEIAYGHAASLLESFSRE